MSEAAQAHAGEGHGEDADHESHGVEHYVKIWGLLVVLLIVSVLGPLLEIRVITILTAFGIAIVKAFLVCKYFMHLDVQPKYVLYFLVTALLFMGLFFFGVAPDVLSHRGPGGDEDGIGASWTNVAAIEQIDAVMAEHAEHEEGEGGEADWSAETQFATTCSPCHGVGGAGDGVAAAALNPPPANFTEDSFWETRDHDHIVEVITNGGAAVGRSATMAAYGGQFDEEQIDALATYVESLH